MLSKETLNQIAKLKKAFIGTEECRVASHFWAMAISKKSKVQTGDAINNLALSYSRQKNYKSLSEEQCKAFEESLFNLLIASQTDIYVKKAA